MKVAFTVNYDIGPKLISISVEAPDYMTCGLLKLIETLCTCFKFMSNNLKHVIFDIPEWLIESENRSLPARKPTSSTSCVKSM